MCMCIGNVHNGALRRHLKQYKQCPGQRNANDLETIFATLLLIRDSPMGKPRL